MQQSKVVALTDVLALEAAYIALEHGF